MIGEQRPVVFIRYVLPPPPGVSATDIISILIDDIKEGMTKGVEVKDDEGTARVFLDVLC